MDASMGAGNHPPLRKEVPLMKKLISILLAIVLMMTLALPVLAEGSASLGGWTTYTGNPTTLPEEVLTCFNSAFENFVGCTYEPVALLSYQIAAGTNYCLLCRCTVISLESPQTFVLVYLTHDKDGVDAVLSIQDIDYNALPGITE